MNNKPKTVLGYDIPLPKGVEPGQVSDGYHTFDELYDHRVKLMIALMVQASNAGYEAGWSKNHSDGKPCFGGGWVITWVVAPNGEEVRYHMKDTESLPEKLEKRTGTPFNGKEETLSALANLSNQMLYPPKRLREPGYGARVIGDSESYWWSTTLKAWVPTVYWTQGHAYVSLRETREEALGLLEECKGVTTGLKISLEFNDSDPGFEYYELKWPKPEIAWAGIRTRVPTPPSDPNIKGE